MKTSSNSILLLFLVNLVLTKKHPCEAGKGRYSVTKGRCVRCKCQDGYQLSDSKDITISKVFGALQCPNCTRCNLGEFSTPRTGSVCVACSTPCQERNRVTDVPCNGTHDVKCGDCLYGYFERYSESVSCTPCTEDVNRVECLGKIAPKSSTPSPYNRKETTEHDQREKKEIQTGHNTSNSNGNQMILVILCVVTIILAVIIGIIAVKCIPKCCNISDWRFLYGSGSTVDSSGSSGSLLKNNLPYSGTDLELDTVPESQVHVHPQMLDPDTTERMRTTVVQRDSSLLRNIATKIDKDPELVFLELEMDRGLIFQEKEFHKGRLVSEFYLAVLQRWVERNYKEATYLKLFEAFRKYEMDSICDIISRELESPS